MTASTGIKVELLKNRDGLIFIAEPHQVEVSVDGERVKVFAVTPAPRRGRGGRGGVPTQNGTRAGRGGVAVPAAGADAPPPAEAPPAAAPDEFAGPPLTNRAAYLKCASP